MSLIIFFCGLVKRELENKIVVLQSKCMQCEDVLKKEERDNRQLAERVANLEMSLRSLDKERMQFQVVMITSSAPKMQY